MWRTMRMEDHMDSVVETMAVLPGGSAALVLTGVLTLISIGTGRSLMRDRQRTPAIEDVHRASWT